jgi:hypothetical protein
MPKPKKNYATLYRAQRKKFYKRKIQEFKASLSPDDFEKSVLLLKHEHIEDVEMINRMVKSL